ncbi:PilZN3 domain-containing protein (plasmid) [Borreliella americana]|uniref:PilZN3 domain-containing protein n=1 Tax=Borreliella americana TaxID=478807 RepID=A0ACD5G5W4_9SPIR
MISSRKIVEYRNKYRDKEVKLSTEINDFLSISNIVNITMDSYSVFGMIYSISIDYIKIILKEDNNILAVLAKNKNLFSIQIKKNSDSNNSSDFFPDLTVNLLGVSTYVSQNKEYNLLKFKFSTSMSEEILIKLGKLLELKFGQNQRIHERIIVDKNSIRRLKIDFDKVFINFNGTKYKCVIKDLSYGGVLAIVFFDEDLNEDTVVDLIFSFEFIDKEISIKGKVRSSSTIQTPDGKVFALSIAFNEDIIPLEYTMIIHNYLNCFED